MADRKKAGEVQTKPNTALKAERNICKRLIDSVLQELKESDGKPWQAMSEDQQDEIIHRVRKMAEELTAELVAVAAGGMSPSKVIAQLVAVSVKAKLTDVKLQLKTTDPRVHDLVGARGDDVVIIIGADPKEFGVGLDGVMPDADQTPLGFS